MIKIVVLDGYTLNPGDLSWDGFRELGELTVYDRTPPGRIIERSKGAEILLINKAVLNKEQLDALPSLKYVGVLATGFNVIDLEAARGKGITVTNIPAYSTNSVAQLTFALILELCHHVQHHSDSVMQGKWADSIDFAYWDYPLTELSGKTIGIIGMGNIGGKVGDIATAFGMEILGADKTRSNQSHRENFRWAEVYELLVHSDIVSIHCPLTSETKGLINKDTLRIMKRSSFLINTSRGPVVADEDLAGALNEGIIAGAGLDVLSVEPPSHDNPLFKAKNCIITPHVAWATKEARSRLMETAVQNLKSFIKDSPVNVVNQIE
jgi:glycerate dehydrogenase